MGRARSRRPGRPRGASLPGAGVPGSASREPPLLPRAAWWRVWPTPLIVAFFLVAGLALVAWHPWRIALRREGGLDVLLVTIDTLRFDALSSYGQARPTSPTIDRLARAGVRFETAHAHNTVTLPSHANLLSGRYPFEHGVRDNAGFRFPAGTPTLATLLKQQGYATAAFVSAFALDSRFGLDHGFDLYQDSFGDAAEAGRFQLPERSGRDTVRLAREWIERQGGRWFAWVHLYEPHAPYRPPEPFASAFRDAPYLGEVAAADDELRPLLEPLLRAGRAGRTIVVLTGDHGESLGEHGEATHGLFAYESTLRVPLVLFAPRLLAPRVVREPVRHVDVLPTVLDLLGASAPAGLPGRSLLPLVEGRDEAPRPSYFEALAGMLGRGWAPLYGIVRDSRKYVDLPLPELYDLGADPHEQQNLVARRPQEREALARAVATLRSGDTGPRRAAESADTRERLAALGYVSATSAPVRDHYGEADDPKRLVHLDRLMQETIARHRDGDLAGALAAAREVVRQRPDMTAALLQVALLERKAGRLGAAIAALEQAIRTNPEDVSVAVLLGSYLGEAGRAVEAAALLEPYAAQPDPPLDVLTARATALARLGRSREALAAFERARRADPGNPAVLVQLANAQLAAGQPQAARAVLEQAERLNPDVALVQHQLGLLALARGDRAAAEARLRRALALDPTSADTQLNLGRLLAATGRSREARPLFESFLAGAPREIYARELRAVAAWLARS